MISDVSTLSEPLQLQVVKHRIEDSHKHGALPDQVLQWIFARWSSWYEKYSEKKAQLFIYKEPKEDEDVEDAVDEQELEVSSVVSVSVCCAV